MWKQLQFDSSLQILLLLIFGTGMVCLGATMLGELARSNRLESAGDA